MSLLTSKGFSWDLRSAFEPFLTLQMLRRRGRIFSTSPANCLGQQPMTFVSYPLPQPWGHIEVSALNRWHLTTAGCKRQNRDRACPRAQLLGKNPLWRPQSMSGIHRHSLEGGREPMQRGAGRNAAHRVLLRTCLLLFQLS